MQIIAQYVFMFWVAHASSRAGMVSASPACPTDPTPVLHSQRRSVVGADGRRNAARETRALPSCSRALLRLLRFS